MITNLTYACYNAIMLSQLVVEKKWTPERMTTDFSNSTELEMNNYLLHSHHTAKALGDYSHMHPMLTMDFRQEAVSAALQRLNLTFDECLAETEKWAEFGPIVFGDAAVQNEFARIDAIMAQVDTRPVPRPTVFRTGPFSS